jgi:uncharacterized membrane protein YgcG
VRTTGLFLIAAFFSLALLSPSAAASRDDFTITDFSSTIIIKRDSSFTVKESLSVDFERPRHGIYRDIPFRYADEFGGTILTPIEVLSVTDGAGNELKSKIRRIDNTMRIRIGDPDTFVSGLQTYDILYTVRNALSFFKDHDELYWNATGNNWNVPILRATCSVALSEPGKDVKYSYSCYTGRIGSTESDCKYITENNAIEFSTKKTLAAREGLTVAVGWDKGLVTPPSAFRRFLWRLDLERNWVFVLPVISLFVMLQLWYTRGRDPRVREAVAPMYGPPKFGDAPLSPAEVGTLIDERLDSRDITAGIVGLAVKGYIRIEETKQDGIIFDSKDYYLARVKEADNNLSVFEKELMADLFGSLQGTMISDLKNTFYVHIESLKNTAYSELTRKKYFAVSPEKVRQVYAAAGFIAMIGIGLLIGFFFGDAVGIGRTALISVLCGIPVFGIARFMPAKTRQGSSAYMDARGFQEFLNRAEKDRLVRMKDDNLFSKFYPYALALDVADNWAKAFEGIYQEAPQWYVGTSGFGTFSPVSFNRAMGPAMSAVSTAIYSAPRGSGISGGGGFSGGGGSSGGGFGGGGGGSW